MIRGILIILPRRRLMLLLQISSTIDLGRWIVDTASAAVAVVTSIASMSHNNIVWWPWIIIIIQIIIRPCEAWCIIIPMRVNVDITLVLRTQEVVHCPLVVVVVCQGTVLTTITREASRRIHHQIIINSQEETEYRRIMMIAAALLILILRHLIATSLRVEDILLLPVVVWECK
jgi:hypothetical protein